jgi:hypothetical protein
MRTGVPVRVEQALPGTGGMRHAMVTALSALAGGGLLIAVGALVSICWTIHPLLAPVAAGGVLWPVSRLLGFAFRSPGRS